MVCDSNFQCWHDGQWKMVLKSVACCLNDNSFHILYNLFCWILFHTWNLDDILFPRGWSLHRYQSVAHRLLLTVTAYFGFYTGPAWSNTKRVWKQAPMKEELQICIKIQDCIAISAFFLHLWDSPSLHVQCSRLNVPVVCCCIQSYGLMSSQRWVEGKVIVPTPGHWCALCAQGTFVSVRIYRVTSLPVPQSILRGHEKPILLAKTPCQPAPFTVSLLSSREYVKAVQDFHLSSALQAWAGTRQTWHGRRGAIATAQLKHSGSNSCLYHEPLLHCHSCNISFEDSHNFKINTNLLIPKSSCYMMYFPGISTR